MALVDEYLLIHADSAFYTSYGATIEQVNRALRALLHTDDPPAWDHLLDQFSGRKEFSDDDPDGPLRAAQMLLDFGGQQIIHGHTPISPAALPARRGAGADDSCKWRASMSTADVPRRPGSSTARPTAGCCTGRRRPSRWTRSTTWW